MGAFDRRGRRRDSGRGGGTPWIRINSPLQLAFAILAVSMVLCMVVGSCLTPF